MVVAEGIIDEIGNPKESQKPSIDYVDPNGEIKHETIANLNDAKRILKTVIQNEDKQIPGTSYQIRDFLLRNCGDGGEIDSMQAFTKNPGFLDNYAPYSDEVLSYIQNPNNWVEERKNLHETIVKEKVEKGIGLSRQIYEAAPTIYVPTIYIVRGNIASGKSTALKEHPHFERMREGLDGIISPDDYKRILKSAKIGGSESLLDDQLHQESLFLTREIQNKIINYKNNTENLSLVVDKRFAWLDDIKDLLSLAQKNAKKVDIFDLDTPLELSIIRVLARDFPRPKFETLNDGSERIRKYRRGIVEEAKRNENITYYILVDTGVGGPTSYLDVAVVNKQIQDIKNEVMFNKLAPDIPEAGIEEAIEKGKRRERALINSYIIDGDYIDRAQKKYSLSAEERMALEKYKGMTPEEAVNKHSNPKLDFG